MYEGESMNNVKVLLTRPYDEKYNFVIEEFKIKIGNYNIKYYNNVMGGFCIEIISNNSFKSIWKHFILHHRLLFINYGYFMNIQKYEENNMSVSTKKYTNIECYNSSKKQTRNFEVVNLKNLITKKSIKKIKELSFNFNLGMQALYYLNCERYESVLIDQKIVILSQIIEGYVIQNENKENQALILTKIKDSSKEEAYFQDRITIVINELVDIDYKYKSEMFKVLKKNTIDLSEEIKNTRHIYSHYLNKKDKKIVGHDGHKNLGYIFFILFLSFQISLLNDLGVTIDKTVEQRLFLIHDLIIHNNNRIKIKKYKSNIYKINQFMS